VTLALSPRWAKEARAIAPFVLGVCALWPLALWQRWIHAEGAVPVAAVVGAIAIGAFSIGGEYTSRTLVWTLSQPESRAALWLRKRVVAIVGVALVLATGWLTLTRLPTDQGIRPELIAEFVTSGLCALTIAPVLAVLGRSPLFALVLTLAIEAGFWSVGNVLAYVRFGPLGSLGGDGSSWTVAFVWWTALPTCAVAIVLDWIVFRRLQAIEGAPLTLWTSPRSTRTAVSTRTAPVINRPWPALVMKEFRLLQMALLGPIFFSALWLVAVASAKLGAVLFANTFDAFSLGYVVLFAGLVGALAGAEEKQLGTHQAQLLAPVSLPSQFLIKLAVAEMVTLVPGVLLVCLLNAWGLPPGDHDFVVLGWPFFSLAAAITLWSLYVATTCATSIRALVLSVPLGALVVTAVGTILGAVARLRYRRPRLAGWLQEVVQRTLGSHHGRGGAMVAALLVVLTVALFAYRNHRRIDLRWSRVAGQVVALTGAIVAALWFYTLVLFGVGL
jgi:hypothetical protein